MSRVWYANGDQANYYSDRRALTVPAHQPMMSDDYMGRGHQTWPDWASFVWLTWYKWWIMEVYRADMASNSVSNNASNPPGGE